MVRMLRRIIGYALISYSIFNAFSVYLNKTAIDSIPDLQTVEYPLWTLLSVQGFIFISGIIIVLTARKKKTDAKYKREDL